MLSVQIFRWQAQAAALLARIVRLSPYPFFLFRPVPSSSSPPTGSGCAQAKEGEQAAERGTQPHFIVLGMNNGRVVRRTPPRSPCAYLRVTVQLFNNLLAKKERRASIGGTVL